MLVRGLSDAGARQGIEVTLVSRANAVLGRAVTDGDGHVLFEPGLTRGAGGAEPALVQAQQGDEDIARFIPERHRDMLDANLKALHRGFSEAS